jgi:hypothetical protein
MCISLTLEKLGCVELGPGNNRHKFLVHKRSDYLCGVVRAVIVVKIDMLDPHQSVELQPLPQIAAFVLGNGDNR